MLSRFFILVHAECLRPKHFLCNNTTRQQLGSVGCDNMTVMIVCFKNGGTMEQFYERIGTCFASVRAWAACACSYEGPLSAEGWVQRVPILPQL